MKHEPGKREDFPQYLVRFFTTGRAALNRVTPMACEQNAGGKKRFAEAPRHLAQSWSIEVITELAEDDELELPLRPLLWMHLLFNYDLRELPHAQSCFVDGDAVAIGRYDSITTGRQRCGQFTIRAAEFPATFEALSRQ